jgi:putative transposase
MTGPGPVVRRRYGDLTHLGHHSGRGVQYLSIRYTERLAQADAVASVGSRGHSYGNALAESFSGLFKAELIHRRGPWKSAEDLEWATLTYIDWFNNQRGHSALGMLTPVEFEMRHQRMKAA